MSPISTTGETPMSVEGDVSSKKLEDLTAEEMTSKDYYFDSYAHFGIHEVSSITTWDKFYIAYLGMGF